MTSNPPRILCIGGHDPTGGAGIQADIETVTALGGQAFTLVTALTAQDTHDIRSIHPITAGDFAAIAQTLLRDMRPDAVKIGLIGSAALVPPLYDLLREFNCPVVFDPVLAAGGGFDVGGAALVTMVRERLLPLTTLVTPNRAEARRLTGQTDADRAARDLLASGCSAVLLTGADEAIGQHVTNTLLCGDGAAQTFEWARLPHRYHGSGCTLASACATCLGAGAGLADAVERAQEFTWQALQRALPGGGQHLPWRRA